jgi:hypothetical protein
MGKVIAGILALVLLVLLASCGESTAATPTAEAQFCQSLTTLGVAANQLTQVNGNTTIGHAKSDVEAVGEALADVKTSAVNVHTARVNDLETAINELQQTVNNISTSSTLSEAATSIQTQAAAVQSARSQLRTQVGCATSTAATSTATTPTAATSTAATSTAATSTPAAPTPTAAKSTATP